MQRTLLASLAGMLLGVCGFAQTANTVVSDTIVFSDGSRPNGTITVSWNRGMNDASPRQVIFPGSVVVPVVNGAFSVSLFPNDVALPPAQCYTARSVLNGVNQTNYWSVPTSSTPVNLQRVQGGIPCSVQSGAIVAPAQINPGPAGQSTVLTSSPTGSVTWQVGGGGGSSLFSAILTGTNNSGQALTVGSTSQITFSGSGIVNANRILGTPLTSLYGNSGKLVQGSGTFTPGDLADFDASGNVVDSGMVAANMVSTGGSYANPSWITTLAATKLTGTMACGQMPALTGDDVTSPGSCTTVVLTTNGVPFAASATTNALNASNISSGTLAGARLPAINLAASGAGGVTGNLQAVNVNSGTNADVSHYLRGDMTWQLISAGGTVTNTPGPLVAGQLMIGNGGNDSTVLGSLGTTTTVYHGNAGGSGAFTSVILTADVSGILPGANGGSNNAFWAVTGPAGSLKTFTFPNASATVLTTNAAVTMAQGGNGADLSAIAKGGLISGTGAGTVGITTVGTNGQVLSADSGSAGGVKWIAATGTGTVTSIATTSPITGGTITTTGTIACATCVTSAAAETLNQLVIGQGSQATATLGSLGTTTTVLHGNAGGAPAFSAVALAADVSGILPYANGGCNSSTAWTAKSILFAGASACAQDNAHLNYDSATAFLSLNGRLLLGGGNVQMFNGGAEGSITLQGQVSNTRTAIDLSVTQVGSLPTGNLPTAELVVYNTLDQATNYGRMSFSAYGNGSFAITTEAGGSHTPSYLAFAMAGVEVERMQPSGAGMYWGLGSATPQDFIYQIAVPGVAGTYNSHRIILDGYGYDSAAHHADWLMQNQVTSQAGASTLVFQNRIGAASFATKLAITDGGQVGIGTTTPSTGSLLEIRGGDPGAGVVPDLVSVQTADSEAADKGGGVCMGGSYTGTSPTSFGCVTGRKLNSADGDYSGYLSLWTRVNGTAAAQERIRITSPGLVLIGATADSGSGAFLQVTGPGIQGIGGTQPTCDASHRYEISFVGATHTGGVKDSVAVCAADASNVYAWRTIY